MAKPRPAPPAPPAGRTPLHTVGGRNPAILLGGGAAVVVVVIALAKRSSGAASGTASSTTGLPTYNSSLTDLSSGIEDQLQALQLQIANLKNNPGGSSPPPPPGRPILQGGNPPHIYPPFPTGYPRPPVTYRPASDFQQPAAWHQPWAGNLRAKP